MNKKLKKAIKEAFLAPAPRKKKEFLQSIPQPSFGTAAFLSYQASYIRRRIWAFDLFIFITALLAAGFMEQDTLWNVSALMPLLALTILTESGRSKAYGMAEFEMSTRFSLKSIVLARLGILGITNMLFLILLIPLAVRNNGTTLFQTGVYMLCPYLITTFFGLLAVRKIHGKESIYLCAGIAVSVSFVSLILHQILPVVYKNYYFVWWVGFLFLFLGGTLRESYKIIKQSEELAWN